jgi:hypothetical protein
MKNILDQMTSGVEAAKKEIKKKAGEFMRDLFALPNPDKKVQSNAGEKLQGADNLGQLGA